MLRRCYASQVFRMPLPTLRAAFHYFLLVFGAGFLLGSLRVSLLTPRVGERNAELCEFPLMLAVLLLASRFIVRRHRLRTGEHLACGALAAGLLFGFEVFLVAPLRGLSARQAIFDRDPLTGSIYYALQLLFALLPAYWNLRGKA